MSVDGKGVSDVGRCRGDDRDGAGQDDRYGVVLAGGTAVEGRELGGLS